MYKKRQIHNYKKLNLAPLFYYVIIGIIGLLIVFIITLPKKNNYGLLILAKTPIVFYLDSVSKKAVIINFDPNIYFNSPYNYGNLTIDSLAKLDDIEHARGFILKKNLEELLALKIDAIIRFENKIDYGNSEYLDQIKSVFKYTNITSFINQKFKNALKVLDYISLIKLFKSFDDNKLIQISLRSTDFPQDINAEGTTISVFNTSEFDRLIGDTFYRDDIRLERLSVSIVNTTNISGIGQRGSRKLNRFGINVVRIGSQEEILDNCILETDENTIKSQTYQLINTIFDCQPKIRQKLDTDISDITLYLGKSYLSIEEIK